MQILEDQMAENYVTNNLTIVTPDASVTEVYDLMQRTQIRHVPVVEAGKAVGIISDRDIRFVSYSTNVTQLLASDIMTSEPYSVQLNTPLKEIVTYMSKKKINSTLIHNSDDKVVGIFTSTDALNILADHIK
ncbi:MAG: CBS domain-containing protein [Bacteriovoracaceae bacterium]|jgi:acetoin utilization protein AcuB|nr:CBS domain-containing protein [Bacteriovoracaceae bacterium]